MAASSVASAQGERPERPERPEAPERPERPERPETQQSVTSQTQREAANELRAHARVLARAQLDVRRWETEVANAERAVASARTEGARETAQGRLEHAREQLQEARERAQEAEQEMRESQQSVEQAAREAQVEARVAADQAREIARQVQIQIPMPPAPPHPGETVIGMPPRGPWDTGPQVPREAVVISIAFFVTMAFMAVGWPLARAFARRMDRKTVAAPAQIPADVTARLERIEHSVEAIAIEVERISEGQRYATKLLSDIRPMEPLAVGGQKVPELVERSSTQR